MAAYALAHDQVYGTDMEQGVILMCTPDCFFQRFIINGSEFKDYKGKFLMKIDQYYQQKRKVVNIMITKKRSQNAMCELVFKFNDLFNVVCRCDQSVTE